MNDWKGTMGFGRRWRRWSTLVNDDGVSFYLVDMDLHSTQVMEPSMQLIRGSLAGTSSGSWYEESSAH